MRTGRVYLRRLERSDLDRCHGWINRPDVYVVMGVFAPRSADEQERWFDALVGSRENLVFALCLVDGDVHVGNVSLFDVDYINGNAGLTIFIGDVAHRGAGYGTDAVWLLCRYAFEHLNLHRVYCKTDNAVAGQLYERLGFSQEGTLREHAFQNGDYVDKVLYGVLRAELQGPPDERGGAMMRGRNDP